MAERKSLTQRYLHGNIDPAQVADYGVQGSNLRRTYLDTRKLLTLQRAQLKQQFRHQKTDINRQRLLDMQATAGASAERGVLGSSADVEARLGVRGAAASQVIQARDALRSGLSSNLSQAVASGTDYRSGLAALAIQKRAMEAQGATQRMIEDAFGDVEKAAQQGNGNGNNGGGGGNGGPGPGNNGSNNPGQDTAKNTQDLGGIFGTGQTIRQLSRDELDELRTAQLRKLWRMGNDGSAKGKITNRLNDIYHKWEDQGFDVEWRGGRLMRKADDPRATQWINIRKGTALGHRRDWVKAILAARATGGRVPQ